MKGETLAWHELASHLHMSKQRCQLETSSTEFLDWLQYLQLKVNSFHREDYFLANIARMIVASNSKDPKSVTLDPFLLKFKTDKPKKIKKSYKQTLSRIKQRWLAWASVKRQPPRKD